METKRFKIEDVILDISMGPFGSDIKKEVYTDSGVPVLNGSNLQGFELVEDSFGYVTEEKADSLKKANAHRGDIVITHRGTIGQIVYIPQNSKFERYVISQSQFRVTCNKDIVLPEYLTYYFHTREGQYKLLSNASQVGVPALARASTTFRKLEIDLPSIEIQRKAIDIILKKDIVRIKRMELARSMSDIISKIVCLKEKRISLTKEYASGVLNDEEYETAKSEIDKQLNAKTNELGGIENARDNFDKILSAKKWIDELKKHKASKYLTQEIVDAFVKQITVYKDKCIEIEWTYQEQQAEIPSKMKGGC